MPKKVAIIAVADLHFSHLPPKIRRFEPDWYKAMERSMNQLRSIKEEHDDAQIVYAGDIFDDGWRPGKVPPELINFISTYLPKGYAIPGQHDLPHHRLEDINKSAFETLCRLGTIIPLSPTSFRRIRDRDMRSYCLFGYPWGVKVNPGRIYVDMSALNIAVIHAPCWRGGPYDSYHTPENHLSEWRRRLSIEAFDVAIFGDNHDGFESYTVGSSKPAILNVGNFMRRRKSDGDPAIGLVFEDGSIDRVELDCSQDSITLDEDDEPEKEEFIDLIKITDDINKLRESRDIDFERQLKARAKQLSEDIYQLVVTILSRQK